MNSQNLQTSHASRVNALKAKHSIISTKLEEEQRRPSTSDFYLRQMKKQKLLLKEQIEGLREGTKT
ncbi:MAG: DUF465 domain-containing protein [Alphaproteobacteria bacterium]|nr:DUF465 domain-containing protein [Alphaproteobacteria bacterium]